MTEAIPQLDRYDEPSLDAAFATLAAEVRTAATALTTPDAQEAFRLHWLGRKAGPPQAHQRRPAQPGGLCTLHASPALTTSSTLVVCSADVGWRRRNDANFGPEAQPRRPRAGPTWTHSADTTLPAKKLSTMHRQMA